MLFSCSVLLINSERPKNTSSGFRPCPTYGRFVKRPYDHVFRCIRRGDSRIARFLRVPTGSHKGRRGRRPLRIFSRRSVGAGFPRPPAAAFPRQSLPLRGRWLRRRRRRKGADGWSEELRQPAINAPSLQIPERDDHTAVWAPSVSLRSTAPPEGEPIKKGYFQSRFARQLPQRGSQ